ncbi:MAG: hypothetical protein ACRCUT_04000, partial [Spirochaetota bacterium]
AEEKTELKVKIRGEAPEKGIISRDNFIAITSSLYNSIFIGVAAGFMPELPAAKIGTAFEFRSDETAKAGADIIISILIDNKGIVLQVSNSHNDKVQKYPITWEQYFNIVEPAAAGKAAQ